MGVYIYVFIVITLFIVLILFFTVENTIDDFFIPSEKRSSNYDILVESIDTVTNTLMGYSESTKYIQSWCKPGNYVVTYKGDIIKDENNDILHFPNRSLARRYVYMKCTME